VNTPDVLLDPYPVWGYSGKRYPFNMLNWVAEWDGPPWFGPDAGCSQIQDDYESAEAGQ
jgi:hypothetical protein